VASEAPGPPAPGGSFEIAKRLLRDYEFADPAIVGAVYAEDSPLERRDLLLEGRFHGLRFHFGVRVGGLVDTESTPSPALPTSPTRSSASASGCSAAGSSAASPGTPACAWPG
jgi:hypothetical protein